MIPKITDRIFLEAIQGLREDIARIDRDMGKDRDNNEKLAMAINANTDQVNQFGKRLEIIEKKIQDKMADVVAPMMEQTQDLKETIEKKKTIILPEKKKSWYKFWK